MGQEELFQLLSEALEIKPSQFSLSKRITDYDQWDSLAWLSIISLLDERYGLQLSGEEIRSFVCVNDIYKALNKEIPIS